MNNYSEHLILLNNTIQTALIQLNSLGKDAILMVVDEEGKLVGSITDGDVRRGLIKGITIDQQISNIIQPHPRFIRKEEYDIRKIIEFRDSNFRVIPVLDKTDKVIRIINFREMVSYLPLDVVIMAGGLGQRLLPLTATTPKPLLKVGNKPIIDHNISRLIMFGVDNLWISVKYLGEQISEYFGDGQKWKVKIDYIWEDQPLGTIGAVSKIKNFKHDYVLVSNSDLLTNLDYEQFFLDFLNQDADMSVLTIPYHVNVPYAVLEVNNKIVSSFKEKPMYTYYSNGGIYLIKKSILELIPENTRFDATDLLEKLINGGYKVTSFPLSGYWLDIGSPEDFSKAQVDIDNIKF